MRQICVEMWRRRNNTCYFRKRLSTTGRKDPRRVGSSELTLASADRQLFSGVVGVENYPSPSAHKGAGFRELQNVKRFCQDADHHSLFFGIWREIDLCFLFLSRTAAAAVARFVMLDSLAYLRRGGGCCSAAAARSVAAVV